MTDTPAPRTGEARLSAAQRTLLDAWLPEREVVADHSWGQVGTYVLEVRSGNDHLIVKAGDERDRHMQRELHAHQHWLKPWTSIGRAPTLIHSSGAQRLLVTRFLPGRLVMGDPAESDPDVYRQAGSLLARFHAQQSEVDLDYTAALRAEALQRLDQPHRMDGSTVERLREIVASWPVGPVMLVPTHGDWQPRNWLLHGSEVSIIDFGRAALRPASSDFVRLAGRQFTGRPDLERAFLDGYGREPRLPDLWHVERLFAAIGTAVWAYAVGDEDFEVEGLRAIDQLLSTT